jgi:hypothetical protein
MYIIVGFRNVTPRRRTGGKVTDVLEQYIELLFSPEATISFRNLVIRLEARERHNTEDKNVKCHRRENFKIYLV